MHYARMVPRAALLAALCSAVSADVPLVWRPCPAPQPGVQWVQLSDGKCTAVTTSVAIFRGQQDAASCTSLLCRCGVKASPAVLQSSADAFALAALLLPGRRVVVGMEATVLTATGGISEQVEWHWRDDGSSSYGLLDGDAWQTGEVPPDNFRGECATLDSAGKLSQVDCSDFLPRQLACSIPACPACAPGVDCPTVSMSGATEGFDAGFRCMPSFTLANITSYHVFPASSPRSESVIDPVLPLGAACSVPWNASSSGLVRVSLLPGDVLRLCGSFPSTMESGDYLELAISPLASAQYALQHQRSCSDTNLPLTVCVEYYVDARLTANTAYTMAKLSPLSLGDTHACSIRSAAGGFIECWGSATLGSQWPHVVPAYLPPALAVIAGDAVTCVIASGSLRVQCWGDVEGMPDAVVATYVDCAGGASCCAVRADVFEPYEAVASLVCWGRPAPPPDIARVRTVSMASACGCAVLGFPSAGALRCWGSWSSGGAVIVPPGLPPAALAVTGDRHACILAAGTGEVLCFGPAAANFPSLWPPCAFITAGPDSVCGVFASNGTLWCWGALSASIVVIDNLSFVSLSRLQHGLCGLQAKTGRVTCFEYGDPEFGQAEPPVDQDGFFFAALLPQVYFANLKDSFSDTAFLLDMSPALAFSRMAQQGSLGIVITLERRQPNSTMPTPPAYLFETTSDLRYPTLRVFTQPLPDGAPSRSACVLEALNGYEIGCYFFSYTYGAEAFVFDGHTFHSVAVLRSPTPLSLFRASVQSSLPEPLQVPSTVDTSAVAASIGRATSTGSDLPRVLMVRAGDTVTLAGSGFGLHAALQPGAVPWWNATARTGPLRSCLHLAWWVSPAAYHNDSACVCNGLEDLWVREYEKHDYAWKGSV